MVALTIDHPRMVIHGSWSRSVIVDGPGYQRLLVTQRPVRLRFPRILLPRVAPSLALHRACCRPS